MAEKPDPITEYDNEKINNHMPTVQRKCQLFIDITKENHGDIETQYLYLISLIDDMEADLKEIKKLIKDKL